MLQLPEGVTSGSLHHAFNNYGRRSRRAQLLTGIEVRDTLEM